MSFKRWLFITILLFGTGVALGLSNPTAILSLLSEDIAAIEGFADSLASLPKVYFFIFILIKNVSALVISFVLSPIFCLAPVIALISNGVLLGLVSTLAIEEKSVGYLLAGILPHGVFELPALIVGEAAALNFGAAVLSALFKKEKRKLLLPNLRQNLKYLAVALILLLPAAIIETYITPLFLD
ncbi:MAG: stage II sporulation protein M [Dehalococcoidales bacterium]|nr:stage II sporulation protein M [Dehalococcoidales bacterium]